jgi:hypothetical protein
LLPEAVVVDLQLMLLVVVALVDCFKDLPVLYQELLIL